MSQEVSSLGIGDVIVLKENNEKIVSLDYIKEVAIKKTGKNTNVISILNAILNAELLNQDNMNNVKGLTIFNTTRDLEGIDVVNGITLDSKLVNYEIKITWGEATTLLLEFEVDNDIYNLFSK